MKIRFLALLLLIFTNLLSAQQNNTFSPLELKMDEIAKQYGDNSSELLQRMDELLANSPQATPAEKALFLAYDCALRAELTSTLAKSRLKDLQNLSIKFSDNGSVRAATALCEAEITRLYDDKAAYKIAIIKAYIYVQQAELATLKYWIGLNAYYTFIELQDYQLSEAALLTGLEVAQANNDQPRLSSVHQLLAELFFLSEQFDIALEHSKSALLATEQRENKQYLSEIYTNQAFILTRLNRLDDALLDHKKSLTLTQKKKIHREVQFINLDIAYLLLLQNKTSNAQKLINDVSQYAKHYDESFLLMYSQMYLSFLQIMDGNLKDKAQQNFSQALLYFKENNETDTIIEAWLKQSEILALTQNYQQSSQAYKQYLELSKAYISANSLALKKIVSAANQAIRNDDNIISQSQLAAAVNSNQQLSKENNVIVIMAAAQAFVLFVILVHFLWRIWKKQQYKREELNRQRYYDPLTQAYNRRYFDEVVCNKLIDYCQNKQTSYLLLIDIDHFKSFNDTYGHSAGDIVLKELVNNLKGDSRLLDSVVRLGGEEFLIILSPDDNLRIDAVVERILKLVSKAQIIIEDTPKTITISIGYLPIENANSTEDINELINLADKGLYIAKDTGRNRAIGIKNLQCPARLIDNVLIAKENNLVTLTEVSIL